LELGIGESLLLKAIAESTGREMKKIKQDYAEIGDLGVVAMVGTAQAFFSYGQFAGLDR
jgi:predicted transcriptional regulator